MADRYLRVPISEMHLLELGCKKQNCHGGVVMDFKVEEVKREDYYPRHCTCGEDLTDLQRIVAAYRDFCNRASQSPYRIGIRVAELFEKAG